jgi:Branched-chain amino acid transport system / permease component
LQHQIKKAAGGAFGHGGFLAIGAYVTALLWNYLHVTPWLGSPLSMLAVAAVVVLIGYPCFRLRNRRTLFRPVDLGAEHHRAADRRRDTRRSPAARSGTPPQACT